MESLSTVAIESFHSHRVAMSQSNRHGRRDTDFRLLRQRHGGMLYQGSIRRLTIGEFDDPLLTGDVEKRLRSRAPHGDTRRDKPLLLRRHRLVLLHFANELVNLV